MQQHALRARASHFQSYRAWMEDTFNSIVRKEPGRVEPD